MAAERRTDAFVVARPKDYRRNVAQALHLMARLGLDKRHKPRIDRVARAAKHEIVKDHQPQLVAKRIERIALKLSSAPDADHVHVAVARRFEKRTVLRLLTSVKGVAWNPVGSLRENAPSVNLERKREPLLAALIVDVFLVDEPC